MKLIAIISFFSVILLSCSFSTHYIQTGSRNYIETDPSSIKIYSGKPQQKYIVIGSIAVEYFGDNDGAFEYLQEKAAELGADAVINVKLTSVVTYRRSVGINGTAVKFKK